MVDGDGRRAPALTQNAFQKPSHHPSRHSKSRLSYGTVPTPIVDGRHAPKRLPIGERIMDKIPTPTLVWPTVTGASLHAAQPASLHRTVTPRCEFGQAEDGMGQITNAHP